MLKQLLGLSPDQQSTIDVADGSPSMDNVLAQSTVFDLEIMPDATGPRRMRTAAAFAADHKTPRSTLPTRSAQDIATEISRRRFATGHNIALHDIPELESLTDGDLGHLPLIDTLWLAPLAFPERASHALSKPYLNKRSLADPVEDCIETVDLLRKTASSLGVMDRDWLNILRWLCGIGADNAGYRAFFDAIIGNASMPAEHDQSGMKQILKSMVHMFQGQVCMQGLFNQVAHAFDSGNGWPVAWALSWVRHRNLRAAPCQWLLEGPDGFQDALDAIGRQRCSSSKCRRCEDHKTALESMMQWFPPAIGETLSFQPPVGPLLITYQQHIMEEALARRDLLGILPTGTGKSRCFQVPALEQHVRTGDLTVVISPLKALMEDQAKKAEEEGLPGIARLHGDLDPITRDEIIEDIREGRTALLYISPEGLGMKHTRSILESRRIGLWVFDEAHCIPAWGKGFRGDYRRAPNWISECGARGSDRASILCLTATARPETQKDIQAAFSGGMGRGLKVIDGGSERPNLSYRVVPKDGDAHEQVDRMLRDASILPEDGQAIVYAYSRDDTVTIAAKLRGLGHSVDHYHAERSIEDKQRVERDFAAGRLRLIVSTIAFGMGVDCPNVRLVVHVGPSASLEAYAQEAGRAGRDKRPANCILIHDTDEHDRRLGLCALGHLNKEDMDAVLAHVLAVQRRIPKGKKHLPTISLPYQSIADDVLGFMKDAKNPRAEEFRRMRVDRIVDELEAHGLIRKVQARSGLSALQVHLPTLDQLQNDPAGLSMIEAAVVKMLALHAAKGEVPTLPDDIDELADACGVAQSTSREAVRKAIRSLRQRHRLLRWDSTLDLSVGARRAAGEVSRWALKSEAVADALLSLLEERAAEEEPIQEQENPSEDKASDKPHPFETTLTAILKRAQAELDEETHLTAKEALRILSQLHKLKLITCQTKPAGLTKGVDFWTALDRDQLQDHLARHHRQTDRVFATLQRLADDNRYLRIDTERLVEEVATGEMDLDATWRAQDGERLTPEQAQQLVRGHLRSLAGLGAIDISAGLYAPREAIRVEIARRDAALTVRSYTQEMFRSGISAFQEEEIRQLHLMDGYARRVLVEPDSPPDLLKAYFAKPSREALPYLFEDEELRVVLQNRPASVQRQIELRSRLDEQQSKIVHDDTTLKDLLVLAGPGAGKTRVLVERIVWLVSVERVPADQILVLCYNRRAAEQIRTRLRAKSALGRVGSVVSVYTYHSFALQVLGQSFSDLSDEAVGEEVQQSDADADSGRRASAFDRLLSEASSRLVKQRADGGSLSDIILRRFRWVFVDEFQDVTDDSFDLIREIAQQSQKKAASEAETAADLVDVRFIAVGDDDQNIYDFGGANGQHIRAFSTLFNVPKERPELTWNYRSSGAILRAAADIISHCSDRLKTRDIEISPDRAGDPLQGHYHDASAPGLGRVALLATRASSIKTQAAMTAAELLRLSNALPEEEWDWNSTAVLVRRRAHIPVVERALSAVGIKLSRDIRGLVPMARVREAILIRRWLERKSRVGRTLTPGDIGMASSWLETEFEGIWSEAIADWLRRYLKSARAEAEVSPEIAVDDAPSPDSGPSEVPLRISPRMMLEEFIEWSHDWRPAQNGAMVLTAHTSKGLEFDNVVICDADWLRGARPTDADRRLFYVAATRARHSLSIVTAHFMGPARQMMNVSPASHLEPVEIAPHPAAMNAELHAPLAPCSVRDVFLSFPAWNGPGCHQNDVTIDLNRQLISALRPGDQIALRRTASTRDRNPWHLYARNREGWHRIGKMQRNFEPDLPGEEFHARVFAAVAWRKQDSDEEQQLKIQLDSWLTIIPEWGRGPAQ